MPTFSLQNLPVHSSFAQGELAWGQGTARPHAVRHAVISPHQEGKPGELDEQRQRKRALPKQPFRHIDRHPQLRENGPKALFIVRREQNDVVSRRRSWFLLSSTLGPLLALHTTKEVVN